jgi:hypothetical protein
MKNKLLAVLAAFGMVASASAVKINDNISINGFIDGSYKYVDSDNAAEDQSLGGDEVELNFNVNAGNVSGMLSIDSDKSENENDLDVEQAHFTYDLGNGVSLTFGRYGSALGFEREDPAGLYTFSRAYNDSSANGRNNNLGDIDELATEGVTVTYSGGDFTLAASFEDSDKGANIDSDGLDLELSFSYTGFENTVIGGGYFFSNEAAAANEVDILNLYASRSFGKLLLAAEYVEQSSDALDTDAYMILADYDYNDKIGAAIRLSNNERVAGGEYEKLTIAPNYAITDSLGAILEVSDVEDNNVDSTEVAVELTFTF